MSAPVRGMWIGEITAMEQLCIRSFLANGHEFHLYSYQALADVPEGAVLHDAREILPESKIFRYTGNGSYAGFSDHFRFELLRREGGWWVDLDTICLQPLPEPEDFAIATETDPAGAQVPAIGVMFSRPATTLLEALCDRIHEKNPTALAWGDTGASLFMDVVRDLCIQPSCFPWQAFCPIPYVRWFDTFLPGRAPDFGPETYAVHYWHEYWRRARLDKNENYGPRSLYEILKRRYGILSPP